ncbi:cytochrome c oxidase subunit 3 [Ichthyenterobacterium sp. W332]|uniref:Cytochrome c oxidase subunit 3 n=1 Tax=Microcosmobacter mediterraneus TaxID=3075607 RepID=A0ABU2YJ58_9FLAO|nr:cytochrome c oxidase subunit 3 [Ichthyenterobacterium sp. W332]MDT0557714.1 cytochrome c oxidase subunit 3 [Ichthyenterobacterium sp. W332]
MDLTQGTEQQKQTRAKKMMLWFGIISLIMSFAGWTSAYIVSRSREDWLSDFNLPEAFLISTVFIVLSSITLIFAKRALKRDDYKQTITFLVATLVLGLVFAYNQFTGFNSMVEAGYNFTGPTSNPKTSFVFLIAFVHVLHIAVGVVCLIVVLVKQLLGKYNSKDMLGFELASNFWHFVDILWIYLFLFLTFVK